MSLDSLSREQLVGAVRRFVRERLVPQERTVAEADSIPEGIVEEMRGLGLFGLSIPEEYGGLGLTMDEEVPGRLRARPHHAGLPLALRHQYRHRLAGHPDRRHRGAEAQLAAAARLRRDHQLLRADRAGERLGCGEPHAPRRGARARAIVLNGTKRFITNAPRAGLFTVMARTQPAEAGTARHLGLSGRGAARPGITVGKPADRKMGQQGPRSPTSSSTNCRVPADGLAGRRRGRAASRPPCRCWTAAGCISRRSASARPSG